MDRLDDETIAAVNAAESLLNAAQEKALAFFKAQSGKWQSSEDGIEYRGWVDEIGETADALADLDPYQGRGPTTGRLTITEEIRQSALASNPATEITMERLGSQTMATLNEAKRVLQTELSALRAHYDDQSGEWQESEAGTKFQDWLDKIEAAQASLAGVEPEPEAGGEA